MAPPTLTGRAGPSHVVVVVVVVPRGQPAQREDSEVSVVLQVVIVATATALVRAEGKHGNLRKVLRRNPHLIQERGKK